MEEDRSKDEKKEPKKEKINCLVAKSALIIPFSFGSHKTPPGILQQRLLDRQILGPAGIYYFNVHCFTFKPTFD